MTDNVIEIAFCRFDPKKPALTPEQLVAQRADRKIIADLQSFLSAAREKVEHGITPRDRAQILLVWGITKDHPHP